MVGTPGKLAKAAQVIIDELMDDFRSERKQAEVASDAGRRCKAERHANEADRITRVISRMHDLMMR